MTPDEGILENIGQGVSGSCLQKISTQPYRRNPLVSFIPILETTVKELSASKEKSFPMPYPKSYR
jgi:hypothetical protein